MSLDFVLQEPVFFNSASGKASWFATIDGRAGPRDFGFAAIDGLAGPRDFVKSAGLSIESFDAGILVLLVG